MGLNGKIALVTGGAQGIGLAIAKRLASDGAHVVLADIQLEAAEKSSEEIKSSGGLASAKRLDVTDLKEVQSVFDSISKEQKLVDILVNNAGITRDGLLVRMKESDWDVVLSTNLKGCFLCTQQATKQMMKQRSGSIVNIASIVGVMGNFGQANYSAAKAGLIGLTKTTAREVASRGVTANAVTPGFIDTEMTQKLDEKVRNAMMEQIPLGKFGSPEDVADSVAFLVSDQAKYITGQIININGGMLM
jgi:3-oxoacyl-[acyl-carrier protein] reductase